MTDDPVVTFLVHNRASLALHTLRTGSGRPLLLLHGLGERTPVDPPRWADAWRGPVLGLDFTGHGRSTVPAGGGYTAEILMADVDTVLAAVGEVSIVGRGLGAYIALLIAGARPELVRGIALADGPGLVGGGVVPGTAFVSALGDLDSRTPDPNALFELSRDVRPPDYAQEYVRQIMQFSGLERPIVVAAVNQPEWLAAVVSEPGVVETSLSEAVASLAAVA
jgi:pimeloyl-ACP methyl ester carboxylesterase